MSEAVGDVVVNAAMFSLMFAMGLTLLVGDFRRIMRAPRATLIGTALQLVVMPMVGLALARVFDLPPLIAAGLVIIAACPGGMFSNMYVHIAGANTALSITLTATATLVTLMTLPLWAGLALSGATGSGNDIEMPVLDTALRLSGLTVLPVLIGMYARSRWPTLLRLEKGLSRSAAIVIVIAVATTASEQSEFPTETFELALAPVLLFSAATLILGTGLPTLMRLSGPDVATIGVEIVAKNALLGIVIVNQTLAFEALVPVFIASLLQTPLAILVLVSWRQFARRGWVEGVRRPAPVGENAG